MQFKPFIDGADARAMIDAGLAAAAREGLAVSVAVADAAGHALALHRMDGAGMLTGDVALRKARTAALLRAPSRVLADRVAADPALLALTDYLPMAGGQPVRAKDGAVAGAVGISGGNPEQDERIAAAALEALDAI
ncbi:MAG: heme-binding protein [Sphingomonas sp.]|uniref:GlcG/HbpS family heme-binding protein n=1 Tax=Sphingomonas sp. TaxID=28214 RepID=UPI001AC9B8F6|nr:heme-binding protein [Sphingomonas sp.]MBN8814296.1 heme-binding protein [Sphingomonas sp.]